MSAVLQKARRQQLLAMRYEMALIGLLVVVFWMWDKTLAFSLCAGLFSGFIPHCVFAYWIFFRKNSPNRSKMAAFYGGELMKWAAAILLIAASFTLISPLNTLMFFAGYTGALAMNLLLPVLLKA